MTNNIFSPLQRLVVRGVFAKQPCLVVMCFSLLLFQGCALLQGPEDIAAPSKTLAPTAIPKTSTAGQPAPSPLVPAQPEAKTDAAGAVKLPQTGEASWYGTDHQGKQTASGASFDPSGLTAAHPTLPFGSKIKVTNLANGKSVEVEITDRGPASGNRIIDLSQAAAKALGMIEPGTANVRLELP